MQCQNLYSMSTVKNTHQVSEREKGLNELAEQVRRQNISLKKLLDEIEHEDRKNTKGNSQNQL